MIAAGKYFMINRSRQYGKTTTIEAVRRALSGEYMVVSLSFEGIGQAGFRTEESFVKAFCRKLKRELRAGLELPDMLKMQMEDFLSRKEGEAQLDELFDTLLDWCDGSEKPIVLAIDEVDSASNNQVFLDFLAQLRDAYINRDTKGIKTFQSVILAGVTDIIHLKAKISPESAYKQNSPWNIAADFRLDMSLSEAGIRGMLDEYEADHRTGMDTGAIARSIRAYTEGYPFLVSRICQLIDEWLSQQMGTSAAWTKAGVEEAVKLILSENNTLFDSMISKLENYPELKISIRKVLMEGEKLVYDARQSEISQMQMYGLIRKEHGAVRIANRIFEMMLYNLFLSDEELKSDAFTKEGDLARNIFVKDGKLDMRLVLERFIQTYTQICGPLEEKFREKDGREQFLLYLRPIINGTGNYYIEAQTRNQTRTDVVVDYLGQQYVIELKIWRGERYNEEGEKQIAGYLEHFNLDTGYMLSFNFNKKKEPGVKRVQVGDKVLFEGML